LLSKRKSNNRNKLADHRRGNDRSFFRVSSRKHEAISLNARLKPFDRCDTRCVTFTILFDRFYRSRPIERGERELTLPEALKMLHMADRHLDDLRFLDPTSTLLQVLRWYEPAQVGQTVVHAISSTFLDDSMRHWILLQQKRTI